MGLGLSALVAIVLLLPGVFYLTGLRRDFDLTAPGVQLGESLAMPIIIVVFASLCAHGVVLMLVEVASALRWVPEPDVRSALQLLGATGDDAKLDDAFNSVARFKGHVFAYVLLTSLVGLAIGRVRHTEKNRTGWHAMLNPHAEEMPDLVIFTAVVAVNQKPFLYSGKLEEYEVDKAGQLVWVALSLAHRRAFHEGGNTMRAANATEWTEIPGEYFVLMMRDVATVCIDYWYMDAEDAFEDAVEQLSLETIERNNGEPPH